MAAKLTEAISKLKERNTLLHELLRLANGETASPGYWERCATADATRTPLLEEYNRQIFHEYEVFSEAVCSELAKLPPWPAGDAIGGENLWLWGGPTMEQGGSMQPDTLAYNAPFFNAENGIYANGTVDRDMLKVHGNMKKLLCRISAPGQLPENDEECAGNLSKLSLEFPNITGAVLDNISSAQGGQTARISAKLKEHNPALELYGIIFNDELADKDYSAVAPHLDGVNLWFRNQEELLELEKAVAHCRYHFPGKKLLTGLFIHDYGTADAGTLPELLLHQLKGARYLLKQGKIDGLVIMGDREILKWPEQAALVRGFLAAQ